MANLAQYVARHPNPAVAQIAQQQLEVDMLFDVIDFQDVPLGGIKEVHMATQGGLQSGDGYGEAIATAAKASATTTQADRALKTIFAKIEFGEIDGVTPTEVMMQIAGRMRGHYTEWLKQFFGSTTESIKFAPIGDLIPSGQTLGTTGTRTTLTFGIMDQLFAKCNPRPKWCILHTNVFNKLLDLIRLSPGIAAINNGGTYELPSGRIDQSPVMYRGAYITYTDHIPIKNTGSETGYDMYALNFDSGNRTGGIGGLAKSAAMLMKLTDLMPDPTIAGYFRNLAMTSAIINYNQYSSAKYFTVSHL